MPVQAVRCVRRRAGAKPVAPALAAGALLVLVAAGACSGGSTSGGASDGGTYVAETGASRTVSCRQKAGADTGSDCAGHAGKPRKLDCDTAAQTREALAAGCVEESEGDSDVCCPLTVSGQKETHVPCTEPADTLTDSDCVGTAEPRKLDCESASAQATAIAAGCRAEDPGQEDDHDVCCPSNVRGGGDDEGSQPSCTTDYSGSWALSGTCPETSCALSQSACTVSVACTGGTTLSGTISGNTAQLTGSSGGQSISCTATFDSATAFSIACNLCNASATKK
jgi:hypothetical protein